MTAPDPTMIAAANAHLGRHPHRPLAAETFKDADGRRAPLADAVKGGAR